jgi:hypothetical protein
MVWLVVVALLGAMYLAYVTAKYWIIACLGGVVAVPVLYDLHREMKVHRQLKAKS